MGANISVVTSWSTPLLLLQVPFYALLGLSMPLDNLHMCIILLYDAHKWMLFLCLKVGVLPGQLCLGLQATENSRELLWSWNVAILSMLKSSVQVWIHESGLLRSEWRFQKPLLCYISPDICWIYHSEKM